MHTAAIETDLIHLVRTLCVTTTVWITSIIQYAIVQAIFFKSGCFDKFPSGQRTFQHSKEININRENTYYEKIIFFFIYNILQTFIKTIITLLSKTLKQIEEKENAFCFIESLLGNNLSLF